MQCLKNTSKRRINYKSYRHNPNPESKPRTYLLTNLTKNKKLLINFFIADFIALATSETNQTN